ncbi:ABC transporter substrate-binding protein [Sinorhizobium meliloti]|uniref:ABC transporter substrate-binding protein n=1 Tax=Rhizobium meliloti TaxID=382 RepID=UPI00299DF93A|nr:ABC transporter substrate-binding protein [Sinorhizobium meliloti]MDW9710400.1 ABC transporter substrate-binding protein [Sinorhizobium meliloti]MDW9747495.1 ABC transporter substrate-binding protein [Sinorhizobium meliloti]MDW9820979.1 ABC transporter substrate-binding protein [Sinorhizobium meliloti]MDW9864370.1 ABC transporter substrate-binding protein [Sinorhizobium meliloti]
MKKIQRLTAGVVMLLASTLAASTAWAQSITIAIGSEPSTLDPQLRDDGGERQVNDNIYETLMARTPTGELVPGLAAQPPKQVDATTWQFKLRDGVKFHNGEPFNADAVVASVSRVIDPANNSEQMAYFGTIKTAEKVDDLTVNLVTTGPDPILPSRMYWMKMIAPGYAKDGDLAGAPVGTGPYKFDSWNRGTDLKLVANADYWGGEPQIDDVTYRFVTEPGTRLSGLLSGEFDVITNLLPEFTTNVPKFAAVPGLETSVFVLGTDNEVTKDPKVREALNLAIDRKAMAEGLFMGYATLAKGSHINPAAFGFNEKLEHYPHDIEKARALIKEAGAEGKPLVVVGESGRWLKDREQIEAVAGYWAETGLNVTTDIQEFSQYLDSLMGDGPRPDAIFIANSNELLDADREMSFIYHKDGAAASNSDAEMATMIEAARVETDTAKRKALYDDIQKKGHDLNYTVPLFNLQDIYGMSERMEWQPRVDAKLMVSEMKVTE